MSLEAEMAVTDSLETGLLKDTTKWSGDPGD